MDLRQDIGDLELFKADIARRLMTAPEQARAYATADFEEPHSQFVSHFKRVFSDVELHGAVLDAGCGPGDISIRFARTYPECVVDGIDGAQAMLDEGRRLLADSDVQARVSLWRCHLPDERPPKAQYQALISNSLLHHLHEPQVLWDAVTAYTVPGGPVFVMDLMRPHSQQQARQLVECYAANEPQILREDFYHSLVAAYTPVEVHEQLQIAGLQQLQVEVISDRHLIVYGRAQG